MCSWVDELTLMQQQRALSIAQLHAAVYGVAAGNRREWADSNVYIVGGPLLRR